MIEVPVQLAYPIHTEALDQALRAMLSSKFAGISTYPNGRPPSVWLADDATDEDKTLANTVIAAHDPVFITVDKLSITADGVDVATITVSAPRPNARAVTLIIYGQEVPIALTGGVGSEPITALDYVSIPVRLKQPANRSKDTFTIKAT